MKIKEIRAAAIKRPRSIKVGTAATEAGSRQTAGKGDTDPWDWASPMSGYPRFKADRSLWRLPLDEVACVVTAEDGTWGLGTTSYTGPVVPLINDHFAPLLAGEDCMATEKLSDMMYRMSSPYGSSGLASCAASAIDIALWDLKGKLLNKPVYELLGGPARDRIFCYASGNDTQSYMELGFKATKLFCPAGPAEGLAALETDEELVSRTRDLIGPSVELMLDCWMGLDVEFAVRLAERLRPYGLKWLEDCLIPDDHQGYVEMRRRLPWQGLAAGEHWFTTLPFFTAASQRVVDVLQPDINWVGGVTAVVKICHFAEAAGISVIPHCGGNKAVGQHLAFAMPSMQWAEFGVGQIGVSGSLDESFPRMPGTAVPEDGYLVPNDSPGLGLEVTMESLEAAIS